jgi:hypothetical protein
MANFVRRYNGGAGYQLSDPVSSLELNQHDDDHTKAPNFAEGSSHIPSADIEVTGPFGLKLMQGLLLKYESRSVPRKQPLVILESVNWQYAKSIPTQTGLGNIYLSLPRLAHDAVLDSVSLRWKGGIGHSSNPVSGGITVPALTVYYLDQFDVEQSLGLQTDDGSLSPAAYESAHPITVSGIGHTIDLNNNSYYVRLSSETGAEFQTGGTIQSLKTICNVTVQAEY